MELVKQKAYRRVFDLAREQVLALPIEEQLTKAGLQLVEDGEGRRVRIPFFDEIIDLDLPGFSFKSSRGANITLVTRIVILHHVLQASGVPVGAELIPYEDIPGCRSYLPVFERRVISPLLSAFGFARDAFITAGKGIGGTEEEYGDASFTVRAFPRVPLTFILWEGDEDFPSSLKVLFDRSIHNYLPLEDIVVVGKMAATRLLKQARKDFSE